MSEGTNAGLAVYGFTRRAIASPPEPGFAHWPPRCGVDPEYRAISPKYFMQASDKRFIEQPGADDINLRKDDTDSGAAKGWIEYVTFTEGEFIESVLIGRNRAAETYRDLGTTRGTPPWTKRSPIASCSNPGSLALLATRRTDERRARTGHCGRWWTHTGTFFGRYRFAVRQSQ